MILPTAREFRIGLLLLVIFLAGGACGALWMAQRAARQGDPDARIGRTVERVVDQMTQEIGLSAEQAQRIERLLQQWRDEAVKLGPGRFQEKLELMDRMSAQVRTNLTAEQLPEFERRLAPFRRRLARRAE